MFTIYEHCDVVPTSGPPAVKLAVTVTICPLPISSTIACIVGLLTVSVVVYPAISVTVTSLVTLYKVPFLLFTYNVLGPGHATIGVVDLAVNRLQYRPLALTFRFNIILCKASNSKIMSVKFD